LPNSVTVPVAGSGLNGRLVVFGGIANAAAAEANAKALTIDVKDTMFTEGGIKYQD